MPRMKVMQRATSLVVPTVSSFMQEERAFVAPYKQTFPTMMFSPAGNVATRSGYTAMIPPARPLPT